jgi:hypothetical protein
MCEGYDNLYDLVLEKMTELLARIHIIDDKNLEDNNINLSEIV